MPKMAEGFLEVKIGKQKKLSQSLPILGTLHFFLLVSRYSHWYQKTKD